jgi:chemotaxis protein MotB
LLFALGSDVVKQPGKEALAGFAEVIVSPAGAGFEVAVVGHTDNRPISRAATKQAHPSNWHLSVHRAIAVASVLQGSGVEPTRIGVTGYGEFRPVATNDTAEGRRQNRRVEIYIVPAGTLGDAPAMAAGQAPAKTTQISRLDDGVK